MVYWLNLWLIDCHWETNWFAKLPTGGLIDCLSVWLTDCLLTGSITVQVTGLLNNLLAGHSIFSDSGLEHWPFAAKDCKGEFLKWLNFFWHDKFYLRSVSQKIKICWASEFVNLVSTPRCWILLGYLVTTCYSKKVCCLFNCLRRYCILMTSARRIPTRNFWTLRETAGQSLHNLFSFKGSMCCKGMKM